MGALGTLIPLVILFVVVGGGAFIGYQIYLWSNQMADRGKHHLEKKNVSFSKDGMRVGVKEVKDEDYADKQQSYLVKAWNYSSFPAYKSKLWNTQAPASSATSPAKTSSTSSSSRPISNSMPNLSAPRQTRPTSVRRTSPGAFPE